MRLSLGLALRTCGIETRPFESGTDFLEEVHHLQPGCLLLDVRMPGMDGIDILTELSRQGIRWPAIVMTGHAQVPTAVQAMKLGAMEFLEKPFEEPVLLEALDRGFAALDQEIVAYRARQDARARVESLTPREMDVLKGVAAGLSNKALAKRLDLSYRTVEMHRSHMMKKLRVASLAEAIAIASTAAVPPADQ